MLKLKPQEEPAVYNPSYSTTRTIAASKAAAAIEAFNAAMRAYGFALAAYQAAAVGGDSDTYDRLVLAIEEAMEASQDALDAQEAACEAFNSVLDS